MLDVAAKFTKPIIAYHGTDIKNLRSILKKGLLPDQPGPWSKYSAEGLSYNVRSMQSLGGVYFSKSLFTAKKTANHDSSLILVIAQIQAKDALPDEDNINIPALHDTEMMLQMIYHRCKLPQRMQSQTDATPVAELRNNFIAKYDKNFVKRKDLPALRAIAMEVLLCEWERRIAHLASQDSFNTIPYRMLDYYNRVTNRNVNLKDLPKVLSPLPVAKAEARLRSALRKFLVKVKSQHVNTNFDMYNFRMMKPVGFSGASKILAILEINHATVVLHYGKIPPVFYEDWQRLSGPVPDIQKPSGKNRDKADMEPENVDIAVAAKNSYEFYTFRGSRNVVLHQRKNGSIVDYHLKKGDVYGVKYTNVQGPEYTAVILHDQPKNVFYVPNGSLKRVLQYSTKYKGAKVTPAPDKLVTPAHLLQTRPAWLAAKPNSMGNRKTWQWFVLAKWANVHVNVNVTPRELYYAARFMVSGFDDTVPESERKKYLMSLHRGRKAQLQLFSRYLTPADCITLAMWIRTPNSKGRPAAIALIGKHDTKWKARGGRYVSVRSKS
jgi:hypothetical protein